MRLTLPMVLSLLVLAALCGCSQQSRKDALQALAKQATSQFKVDRGFHIIDGQPVYLDSNASEGKITRQLSNVDPTTFRILPRIGDERVFYAADGNRVYVAMHYNVIELPNADGASFELFPGSYSFSRDKRSVFYFGVTIEDADRDTFTVLSDCFAKDSTQAYLGIKSIPVRDILTWAPLADGHAEDPCYRSSSDTHPRPATDLSAFGWSKDNATVYWGCEPVDGANASKFVALSKFYGKDDTHVYHSDDLIVGADASSFSVIDPPPVGLRPDASDKHRTYKYGKPE